MARPTKLTPELTEQFVRHLRVGNYAEPVCRALGIGESTYYRWLQRGEREDEGIYHDFAHEVRKAEADAELHAVTLLRRAMPDNPRLIFEYLERRYPSRWRRHSSTEISGPDGGPIRSEHVDLTRLTNAQLADLERILEQAADTQ